MAAGWAFHLDGNGYLVLGVPLVAAFQILVRRRGLQRAWVRDADWFSMDRASLLIAVLLMVIPGIEFLGGAIPSGNPAVILWFVCCLAGCVAAAFAIRRQGREAARRALPALGMVFCCGCVIMAASALGRGKSPIPSRSDLLQMLRDLALYFPVCFVLEEVAFRGVIDAHLFDPEDEPRGRRAWGSAAISSFLWGIWHLPLVETPDAATFLAAAFGLSLVHITVGIPLAFCWRRGGTLVMPAAAHALIDAYRNAVMN
jgi:membrane protease YdiL (CAAX protease family)